MLWVYGIGSMFVLIGISAFFGAPYVPSRRRDIKRLFNELIPLTSEDVVLDMGSGDGVVLREVSRRGAKAVGYEIHPLFVWISKLLSFNDERVTIHWANAWTAAFPKDVTVVYIFSVGRDGRKLARKAQREADILGRPVKLVCYGNPLPGVVSSNSFEAYTVYIFQPLHLSKA